MFKTTTLPRTKYCLSPYSNTSPPPTRLVLIGKFVETFIDSACAQAFLCLLFVIYLGILKPTKCLRNMYAYNRWSHPEKSYRLYTFHTSNNWRTIKNFLWSKRNTIQHPSYIGVLYHPSFFLFFGLSLSVYLSGNGYIYIYSYVSRIPLIKNKKKCPETKHRMAKVDNTYIDAPVFISNVQRQTRFL